MKKRFFYTYLLVASLFLAACGGNNKVEEEKKEGEGMEMKEEEKMSGNILSKDMTPLEADGLKFYPMSTSPEFPDAKLTLSSPESGSKVASGTVNFDFEVESETYKLGDQTSDAEGKNCANSGKGQHIHFIANNTPYSAHYEADFAKELPDGNHRILAFISRSYHESIKTASGYQLFQLTVGESTAEEALDLTSPYLVYSRPKGEYSGEDAKKVMLDFYLVNTEISPEGNKVKATINEKTEVMIANWMPYVIEGLPMGENTIKLELVDKDGNAIDGELNTVERKFTLSDLK